MLEAAFTPFTSWFVRVGHLLRTKMSWRSDTDASIVNGIKDWLRVSRACAFIGIFATEHVLFGMVGGFFLPTLLVAVGALGFLQLGLLVGAPYVIWEGIHAREWKSVLAGRAHCFCISLTIKSNILRVEIPVSTVRSAKMATTKTVTNLRRR